MQIKPENDYEVLALVPAQKSVPGLQLLLYSFRVLVINTSYKAAFKLLLYVLE